MSLCDERRRLVDDDLERWRALSDAIVDGLAIVSAQGLVRDVNRSLTALLGRDALNLVGRPVSDLFAERYTALVEALFATSGESDPVEVGLAGLQSVAVSLHLRRIVLHGETLVLLTFHDLRARHSAEEQIGRDARHDPLTGLRNRLGLDIALATEQTRAERYGTNFAVLCLDLDGFKAINDGHGHPAGDEALRIVARRITEVTRETDLAFRLGGDEFLILQTYTDEPHQSARLAERLIEAIGRPFFIGDTPLDLGVSIGIAHFPDHGRTREDLLHNADAALYKAKREGKNTHRFFDESLDRALGRRRSIEAELMHAIDRGELGLLYEPQLDVASGSVVGFEARLSWQSSRLGLVSPAVFLPIAEQAGLMNALGEWTIHEACRQAATWSRPLRIGVSVSLFQIKGGDLTLTVAQALKSCGLDPARLRVDVAEATMTQGGRLVGETLTGLKALGVGIGLEDFGTGTAAIAVLDGAPFDLVKLDAAFARHDAARSRRLEAIVAVARVLGLPVAAADVADAPARDRLVAAGIGFVQGEVVSPPRAISCFAPFIGTVPAPSPRAGGSRALSTLRDLLRPLRPADIPVLVVDDSEIVGDTLCAMLAAFGFTNVHRATDGVEAWATLNQRPFGLVISDWNMAPVSGIELLAQVRADPALHHLRFLMLTANARTTSRIAARDAGVDGFLVKPFRPDALAAKILDLLSARTRSQRVA